MRYRFTGPWKRGRVSYAVGETLDTAVTPVPNELLAELLATGMIKEDLRRGTYVRDRMHKGITTKGEDDG